MKLPPHAKLVFKGEIFNTYQWEQEMFDGTHQTFEMLKRPDTNQIIATVGEKVLVTKESQPNKHNYFSLPGGRVEEGEDPLEGAKRELLEETGYESDDWELFRTYDPLHKIDWSIYYYIARNCRKVAEPTLDAGEKIEVMEFAFEDFCDFITGDEYKGDFVTDMLRMKMNGTLNDFKTLLFAHK
ncbi:MAG: hypothetical protein RI947_134 [Candidatus Parcubacteria bacterium]|jgi:ADP-ribose pyrophosphatase